MSLRLAAVAAFLLITTAPSSADLIWGVNGHPIVSYPGIPIEKQLDFVKNLGLKSYRVNITTEDEADTLAQVVKAGKARGIEILPVITPGLDLDKDQPDQLYVEARKLAVALGARFKNDIRVWELGNEMENYAIIKPCEKRDDGTQYPCGWGPAGGKGILDYYGPRWLKVSSVLKGLSDGMTQVDPGIRKAIGTAGWGHTGAFARMKQDGIAWDISVWHMYGEDPEWAFREISSYGKPIWVTEFNNPYGSQHGERQQDEGVRQTMTRLRQLQGNYKVEAAHIYELLDETYWAPSFEANMGLVRLTKNNNGRWVTGEPKPAYMAVRDIIRGPQPLPMPNRNCDSDAKFADGFTYVRQVNFAYCLVLGHDGDAAGLDRWSTALENGDARITDVVMEMIRSEEFEAKYATIGLTDRAYIAFLYKLLLDRPGDSYGMETYSRQLRGGSMTRDAIALGIVNSSEFKSRHAAASDTSDVPAPG
ncbi:DUF4214 domain-containing protein [Mesorhizobium sp. BH1-1-5]|uniref:DUF4214 domain-containing protein n=1 Tax=Mesorhizobium sp. BH1-1-5 TaxID=2876661 RepID=UPI001CCBE421|nr:DUF4214 domain-containing protein [Mesorhizobium sp. BH1-1-5]MBZ9991980.1 DUF4214 domain-containing protein [Mesorhizobium sp. BH1-1-5]